MEIVFYSENMVHAQMMMNVNAEGFFWTFSLIGVGYSFILLVVEQGN